MLGSSSVFEMPQAQLSMWGCDYILLENERRFQVYCSGCRVHPDAFQSDVGKHSSNICQVKACLWWPRCAGMAGCIWPGWRPFCPLTCSATHWFPSTLGFAVAAFASLSVSSFPLMPIWLGSHTKSTFLLQFLTRPITCSSRLGLQLLLPDAIACSELYESRFYLSCW